jgi:hypothetical protein
VLRVLVSVVERDLHALGLSTSPGARVLDAFACAITATALQVTECRAASAEDVLGLSSSWAKRLGIPRRRPAWLLTAVKPAGR